MDRLECFLRVKENEALVLENSDLAVACDLKNDVVVI